MENTPIDLQNEQQPEIQPQNDPQLQEPVTPEQPKMFQKPITEIKITDENVALNVIVSFLNVAQKRGCFSIDESAKIWECIQFFVSPASKETTPTPEDLVSFD